MEQDEFRDLAVNNQAELERLKAGAMASSLYNEDLAPTGPERRTWTTYNIAALWIGMSVVITGWSYPLAVEAFLDVMHGLALYAHESEDAPYDRHVVFVQLIAGPFI